MKRNENQIKRSRQNIIDRGFYHHPQPSGSMAVKQYIITKENDKKLLHLRFFNESSLSVTGISLKLSQFTKDGKLILVGEYSASGIRVMPGSTYAFLTAMELADDCADFLVDVVSLNSSGYRYEHVHGKLVPRFHAKQDVNSTNGADGTVTVRKKRLGGGPLSAFIALILVLISIAAYFYFSDNIFGQVSTQSDDDIIEDFLEDLI